jgi:hypothetical protein
MASTPPELAGDLTAAAEASGAIVDALDGIDMADPEAVSDALAPVGPPSPDAQAAADRVADHARQECGFDPDAIGSEAAGPAVAESPEPADPCTFVDPQPVADAAGVAVDVTDRDGSGDIDLGAFATRSCSYGNGAMTISTITYTGAVEDVRGTFVDNVEANGGAVVADVALATLPPTTLVTEVNGFASINVLDAATPFGVGVEAPIDPAALVAAAEAVLAQ